MKKENKKPWESRYRIKIMIKKDAIQSSDISVLLYGDKQKNLQEKLKKLNEKEQSLVMK
ncbi:hypothetical protein SB717_31275 [Priestia sp. SIMBA_032]|uniref:hypothetical protein n=1 Tax=Priestia sp. SIMBA_032 TaxID=3085775 RepID=UPI00397A276A